MSPYLSKSLLLLSLALVICGLVYPLSLWVVGQAFFPFQANGSLLTGPDGNPVGSRLIAQPFSREEYFQPRPSAASYDASASASSSLAASNYALRDRVARMLGPMAKYRTGPRAGQLAAPDIERWFRQDAFQGKPHIVAQWAGLHNSPAIAWVRADPAHEVYVEVWAKSHPAVVARFIEDNPDIPEPKAADLAVVFFETFSRENPGRFPAAVRGVGADGRSETRIEPVGEGPEVRSIFFDMWLQDHPGADLEGVPGDMVTASASGLDPDITLRNAEFQLDRVAAEWAAGLKRDPAAVRKEIGQLLEEKARAPARGLFGEKMLNVLELNLELRRRYGAL
ncbi:potassium-transporting ATPase subunit C [Syntrophobacter fumaroxidans]|uniref:Potassium-transporting ATPase KdpC subunit n=1 Tax=Syntrophobacter fumaroxidans (strain DSM 10017 / MPOB) TaxID=335543 RepID=A0LLJ4_SYNFM|nr:potassium-transporting ATPase subunit C [Syntrophobacter fumaroxidans]ABK18296.1 K+ transporting ATPase, KdpC subunit [Syntrophobacter fumaroxidans MPOB]